MAAMLRDVEQKLKIARIDMDKDFEEELAKVTEIQKARRAVDAWMSKRYGGIIHNFTSILFLGKMST